MLEMDQINDQFKDVDVAVVVGANDVINLPPIPTQTHPSTACPS